MSTIPLILPTGTDGHTPILGPSELFVTWSKEQIYLGQEGLNKYIPKIGDLVFDIPGYVIEWVSDIKPDFTPVLLPWTPRQANNDDESSGLDQLISLGGGCSDTIRLLVNKSYDPHMCAIDQAYTFNGHQVRYARVFRGTPSEPGYEVISMTYDASGNFISHDVGLDTVLVQDPANTIQRTVKPFYTTMDIKTGESCTVVLYGENGQHLGDRRLVVMESGWVHSMAADVREVEDISLETWLLSPSEPNVIDIPMNLLSNSLNAIGVVHYNDGSTRKFPAMDGEHFDILGMNHFIASTAALREPIWLRYTLAQGEISTQTGQNDERRILKRYYVRTVPAKNEYSVRLWCYPVWIDSINGYRLEWFFTNLERQAVINVTSLVHYNTDTNASFNPKAYGLTQTLSVSINLADISPAYHAHRHVQVFNVDLLKQGTESPTLWRIADDGVPGYFGVDNLAKYVFVNQNLKRLRVDLGALNEQEWLDRLYYKTNPLYDQFSESRPPTPNYFSIEVPGSNQVIERPLEDWNKELVFTGELKHTDTIFIRFLTHSNNQELVLSIAGVPLHQVDSFI